VAAIGEKGPDGPLACCLLTDGAGLHDLAGMSGPICHWQAEQRAPTHHGVKAHRDKSPGAAGAVVGQNVCDALDVTGSDWGLLTTRFAFVPG